VAQPNSYYYKGLFSVLLRSLLLYYHGSHSVISKKKRLFMKKTFIHKKQKCKKTYKCKYMM